jgi:hypothetical protein
MLSLEEVIQTQFQLIKCMRNNLKKIFCRMNMWECVKSVQFLCEHLDLCRMINLHKLPPDENTILRHLAWLFHNAVKPQFMLGPATSRAPDIGRV